MPKSLANKRVSKVSALTLDNSMGYLVRRTFRAFTHALEQRLIKHDISISMWFFLRLLWEQDGVAQKDISDQLGLTPPTTVAAMDNLEKRGLIFRQGDPRDRRKTNIFLTRAGKVLRKKLRRYAFEVNAIALSRVSSSEQKALRLLLLQMIDSLDANEFQ